MKTDLLVLAGLISILPLCAEETQIQGTNGELFTRLHQGSFGVPTKFTRLVRGPGNELFGFSGDGNTGDSVFKVTEAGVFTELQTFQTPAAIAAYGRGPAGPLIAGDDGNFYGALGQGGTDPLAPDTIGMGAIIKVTPAGVVSVLHAFGRTAGAPVGMEYPDGATPVTLVKHSSGTLYGATSLGGASGVGGVFFSLTTGGAFAKLADFAASGVGSIGRLSLGVDGNFYAWMQKSNGSAATVVRISTSGTITPLLDFPSAAQPAGSKSELIGAADGSVVGLTGTTLFRITTAATLETLHEFTAANEDYAPAGATLVVDNVLLGRDGKFYVSLQATGAGPTPIGAAYLVTFSTSGERERVTDLTPVRLSGGERVEFREIRPGVFLGGTADNSGSVSQIFKLALEGEFDSTTLHTVTDAANGTGFFRGVTAGDDGNLYGVTSSGGTAATPQGVIFRVTPSGQYTVLHDLSESDGRSTDYFGLVKAGVDFFGVLGGSAGNGGKIFRITTAGNFTILHTLPGTGEEGDALGGLALGQDGNLYGVTGTGGANNDGTFFKITTAGAFTKIADFTRRLSLQSLVAAPDGNFHATSINLGPGMNQPGIVRITPAGAVSEMHVFSSGTPVPPITVATDGSIYGVATTATANVNIVWKLTAAGAFSVVKQFNNGGVNGDQVSIPASGLVVAADGTIIGPAHQGRIDDGSQFGQSTPGAIYALSPSGSLSVVKFLAPDYSEGEVIGRLTLGPDGRIYGGTELTAPTLFSVAPVGTGGGANEVDLQLLLVDENDTANPQPNPVQPGQATEFYVIVDNNHPMHTATAPTVLLAKPAGAPVAACSLPFTDVTLSGGAPGVQVTLPNIVGGGREQFTISFTIPAGTSSGTLQFGGTTVATAPDTDGDAANNSAGLNFHVGDLTPTPAIVDAKSAPSGATVVQKGKRTVFALSEPSAVATSASVGSDPVNMIFGNFLHTQVDLACAGPLALAPVVRTYNSAGIEDGLLGFGWSLSLDVRVLAVDADTFDVRRGDGRMDRFTRTGTGATTFAAAPPLVDVLREITDGYELETGDRAVLRFNAMGRVLTITTAKGYVATFTYDRAGKWTGMTDPAGRKWKVALDRAGRVSRITDPSSRKVSYKYDVAGNLAQVTNANGGKTLFTYDAGHRLTRITDAAGRLVIENTYGADGRVTQQNDGRGTSAFTYQAAGTTLTDPLGRTTSITFDTAFRITSRSDGEGNTIRFAYDASDRVKTITDPNGGRTAFTYDARHNLTALTDARGKTTTFTYDARDNPLTATDPLGHTSAFTYNANDDVLTFTDASGRSLAYAYDTRGLLASVTDPLGNVTRFAYDKFGNLASATNDLGQVTGFRFDKAGRVTAVTDPLRRTARLGYDKLNHVTRSVAPDGGATLAAYDKAGNLVLEADPLARKLAYAYSAAGDLVSVTDNLRRVTGYTHDAAGQLTKIMLPDSSALTFAYDDAGRLITQTTQTGRTVGFTYDANGNLTALTDPLGRDVAYAYDALNRLTTVTDELGGQVGYAYDDAGRNISTTDPNGRATTFTHDNAGRVLTRTDPLSNAWTFTYDNAGRLATSAQPTGQSVAFAYDAANRLLSLTPNAAGQQVTFAYDAAGQRITMTDPSGITSFAYDKAGRLANVASPRGAVSYAWNKAGQRTRMVQPGVTTTYGYDKLGRLALVQSAGGKLATYAYNALGALATETRANGTATSYSYDADGFITGVAVAKTGTPLWQTAYTRNALGLVTAESRTGYNASYTYDGINRLTAATVVSGATHNFAYTYDAAGNRLTATENGATTTCTYDFASRLATIDGGAITHDAAGRLTNDGDSTFTWDAFNRLTAIAGPQPTTFAFDGHGLPVTETIGGQTTTFLHDLAAPLPLRIATTTGSATSTFAHGFGPLASTSAGVTTSSHTDALGSVRLHTDAAGALAANFDYAPFGAALGATPALGYVGQGYRFDGSLLDMRARLYSPALGRFLTKDPLMLRGLTGLANPYAYALNNPINAVDINGQNPVVGGVVGAVAGGAVGFLVGGPVGLAVGVGVGAAAGAGAGYVVEQVAQQQTISLANANASKPVPRALQLAANTTPVAFPPIAVESKVSKGGGVISKGNGGIVAPGAGGGIVAPGAGGGIVAPGAGGGIVAPGAGGGIVAPGAGGG